MTDISHLKTEMQSVLDMWKSDTNWDKLHADDTLTKIGQLHAKYLDILCIHKLAAQEIRREYATHKKFKREYFSGKLNEQKDILELHKLSPFQFVLKSDIEDYFNSDPQLQLLETEIDLHQQFVEACTYIIKELTNRTYQVREYLQWQKFTQGGY